jgi:hypothetical protein
MGYCTQLQIETRITAAKVLELCKLETVVVVVPEVIKDSDSEIDMYETALWPADSKTACSLALSIEGLYGRHGTGKIPGVHARRAEIWRGRLEDAGLKDGKKGTWQSIAYDPLNGETDAELRRLKTGRVG